MAAKARILAALFLCAALIFVLALPARPQAAPRRAGARPSPTSAPPLALPPGIDPPAYKAGPMPFHEGERLVYQASWIGIPAATARVEVHKNRKDPSLWQAEAWIETNQAVDMLFKMRDYMTEQMQPGSLIPNQMYIRQRENQRSDDYRAIFDREQKLVTLTKTNHKGTQTKLFIAKNPWGPLSGAMMALSLPLAPGERYSIDVFTGTTRYVFDFKVVKRERITTQLGTFDALRLIPGVLYESGGKLTQSATGTTIWVTADERHLPLRAEAQAFIGKVRADLIEVSG
jgi:hypothetical protein